MASGLFVASRLTFVVNMYRMPPNWPISPLRTVSSPRSVPRSASQFVIDSLAAGSTSAMSAMKPSSPRFASSVIPALMSSKLIVPSAPLEAETDEADGAAASRTWKAARSSFFAMFFA